MAALATPATKALDRAGIGYVVHQYDTRQGDDSAATYGEAVAAELGFSPDRVLKTLIASVDGEPMVAVVPASTRLHVKALARAMNGKRAELADPADAQRLTGYVVGGISPFGQKRRLAVVVDVTALDHESVLVNGGRRGIQLEVAPADLVAVTGAATAQLAGGD